MVQNPLYFLDVLDPFQRIHSISRASFKIKELPIQRWNGFLSRPSYQYNGNSHYTFYTEKSPGCHITQDGFDFQYNCSNSRNWKLVISQILGDEYTTSSDRVSSEDFLYGAAVDGSSNDLFLFKSVSRNITWGRLFMHYNLYGSYYLTANVICYVSTLFMFTIFVTCLNGNVVTYTKCRKLCFLPSWSGFIANENMLPTRLPSSKDTFGHSSAVMATQTSVMVHKTGALTDSMWWESRV